MPGSEISGPGRSDEGDLERSSCKFEPIFESRRFRGVERQALEDLDVPVDAADTARKGIASALAIANEAHPYSKALFRSAQESFVHGWQQAMCAGVLVMTIVLAYVLIRGPECTSSHSPE